MNIFLMYGNSVEGIKKDAKKSFPHHQQKLIALSKDNVDADIIVNKETLEVSGIDITDRDIVVLNGGTTWQQIPAWESRADLVIIDRDGSVQTVRKHQVLEFEGQVYVYYGDLLRCEGVTVEKQWVEYQYEDGSEYQELDEQGYPVGEWEEEDVYKIKGMDIESLVSSDKVVFRPSRNKELRELTDFLNKNDCKYKVQVVNGWVDK